MDRVRVGEVRAQGESQVGQRDDEVCAFVDPQDRRGELGLVLLMSRLIDSGERLITRFVWAPGGAGASTRRREPDRKSTLYVT